MNLSFLIKKKYFFFIKNDRFTFFICSGVAPVTVTDDFGFQIEFKYGETVTDLQLVGAKFVHDAGRAFCVTGYDSSDLVFFVQ